MHAILHARISACIAACTRAIPHTHRLPRIWASTHARILNAHVSACVHAFLHDRTHVHARAHAHPSLRSPHCRPPSWPGLTPARPYVCLPDRTSMHGSPPALTQAIKYADLSIELAPRIVAAGYRCSCELAGQRASSSTTRTASVASAIGALPLAQNIGHRKSKFCADVFRWGF